MSLLKETIIRVFKSGVNPDNAKPMKAYMKNKFEFLGIKSPERKELLKPILHKSNLPPKDQIWPVIRELWALPQREYQYAAMEILSRYNNSVEKDWIDSYEFLIIDKSWWDTVDFIAINLVGNYFQNFPDQIRPVTEKWMKTQNIWLQRSCLLFQLNYKENTDTKLLSSFIVPLASNREFFIAKAIGWSLRQHSKYDPGWVVKFVNDHPLQPLSKKEALKVITRSS